MASAASMTGTKPFVSTRPIARCPLAIVYLSSLPFGYRQDKLLQQFAVYFADDSRGVRIVCVQVRDEFPCLMNANLYVMQGNSFPHDNPQLHNILLLDTKSSSVRRAH